MKKAETQEQEFLEVCSSYDHDLLTGKKEMTLKDYERITYLVSSLRFFVSHINFVILNTPFYATISNKSKENLKLFNFITDSPNGLYIIFICNRLNFFTNMTDMGIYRIIIISISFIPNGFI